MPPAKFQGPPAAFGVVVGAAVAVVVVAAITGRVLWQLVVVAVLGSLLLLVHRRITGRHQ